MRFRHVAERVFNTPLLITPAKLEQTIAVLNGRMKMQALPMRTERELAVQRRTYEMSNGIAIIPIVGSLVYRDDGMAMQSGVTPYQALEMQLMQAANDQGVNAILLDIDSGGGEANGCFDVANIIYDIRGIKPIWAIANHSAASGGYALGSAADRFFVTEEADTGSIGVIMAHLDASKYNEEEGLVYTLIYQGKYKTDFTPSAPLSDHARAFAESSTTTLYNKFVSAVARNRGMDEQDVRNTEAALYFGADAVTAGLADDVANFRDVLAELTAATSGSNPKAAGAAQFSTKKETPAMTTNTHKPAAAQETSDQIAAKAVAAERERVATEAAAAATAAAIEAPKPAAAPAAAPTQETREQASAKAVADERSRISGIHSSAASLGLPASSVDQLIANGTPLAEANATLIQARAQMDARTATANSVATASQPHATATPAAHAASGPRTKEALKAVWDKDAALQEEFSMSGGFEAYAAFEKAKAEGRYSLIGGKA